MPTLTITKTYNDTEVLDESDLDNIKNDVETFLNTTKLDADNLQDSAVTAAKIGSSAVTTAKINDAAVTTAKINDSAVTQAKLADRTVSTNGTDPGAGGISMSSSVTATLVATTSLADITGLSTILTTLGRPVKLRIQSTSTSATPSSAGSLVPVGTKDASIAFLRGSTVLATFKVPSNTDFSHEFLDDVAAGTYTYKMQGSTSGGAGDCDITATSVRLVAYEL